MTVWVCTVLNETLIRSGWRVTFAETRSLASVWCFRLILQGLGGFELTKNYLFEKMKVGWWYAFKDRW